MRKPMRKLLPLIMSSIIVTSAIAASPNSLLEPWAGPYGGVPPFDKAKPDLLAPALEAGMAEHLAELERIANDPSPPNFANTIAAMERSGRALDRAGTVYSIYSATLSDDAVQEVERLIEKAHRQREATSNHALMSMPQLIAQPAAAVERYRELLSQIHQLARMGDNPKMTAIFDTPGRATQMEREVWRLVNTHIAADDGAAPKT